MSMFRPRMRFARAEPVGIHGAVAPGRYASVSSIGASHMHVDPSQRILRHRSRRVLGWLGIIVVIPMFLWLPLGALPFVPGMIEVFGIEGLRTPAAIAVGGLLLAAIGFHDF